MGALRVAASLAAMLALGGCETPTEAPVVARPLHGSGFTAEPPTGWVIPRVPIWQSLPRQVAQFIKQSSRQRIDAIIVGAASRPIEMDVTDPMTAAKSQFLHALEQVKGISFGSTTLRLEERLGSECARIESGATISAVPDTKAVNGALTMHLVFCRHPDAPDLIIYAIYVAMVAKQTVPPDALPEATALLASFQPEPLGFKAAGYGLDGAWAMGIAVADNAIWLGIGGKDGKVVRIDPATGKTTATVPVGHSPRGLAVGGGTIWVANHDDNTVSRIDPAAARVTATVPVGKGPLRIAFGAGAAWVANDGNGTVSRIDPATNAVTHSADIGQALSGIAVAAGSIWVTDFNDQELIRLDPGSLSVVARMPAGRSNDILADGDTLWVTDQGYGKTPHPALLRYDASQPKPIATRTPLTDPPSGIAKLDSSLWLVNRQTSTLTRVALEAAAPLPHTVPSLNCPQTPLAFRGALWVSLGCKAGLMRLTP